MSVLWMLQLDKVTQTQIFQAICSCTVRIPPKSGRGEEVYIAALVHHQQSIPICQPDQSKTCHHSGSGLHLSWLKHLEYHQCNQGIAGWISQVEGRQPCLHVLITPYHTQTLSSNFCYGYFELVVTTSILCLYRLNGLEHTAPFPA